MPEPLVIVGAGGFGREVAWLVTEVNREYPQWRLLGFADDAATQTVEDYPVVSTVEGLAALEPRPYVVCAIGNPRTRRTIVRRLEAMGLRFATLIEPSVRMSEFVEIGEGSVVCAGTVITTNVRIGKHSLLNLGCRVGHDTVLGDYTSLMPGTNLAGEVTVGEGCYFGLNACVINEVTVGEWSVIGAGAAVVKDIPPHVVAVGVPARVARSIE